MLSDTHKNNALIAEVIEQLIQMDLAELIDFYLFVRQSRINAIESNQITEVVEDKS